jgi:hypothetical protein
VFFRILTPTFHKYKGGDPSTGHISKPQQPSFSKHSHRRIRIPKRYKDFLPSSATPLTHIPNLAPAQRRQPRPPSHTTAATIPPQQRPDVLTTIQTEPNEMGLYHSYTTRPSIDPDDGIALADVCDTTGFSSPPSSSTYPKVSEFPSFTPSTPANPFAPFSNPTIFHLMNWWSGNSTKSASDLDRLVQDVLLQKNFDQSHLLGFRCSHEAERLDKYTKDPNNAMPSSKGWKESVVKIRLPPERATSMDKSKAPVFEVPGVFHRSIVDIIKDAFQETAALAYHYTPFKYFWKPSKDEPAQRLYSELYSSDAMIDEYERLQSGPSEPGCGLERAIASIMLWSDSTHLTSFGNASLWPIYLFFGNQSKYVRAKPTSFACHHLAYMPHVCNILFNWS